MSGIATRIFQRGHDPQVQSIHSSFERLVKAYFERHSDAYRHAIDATGVARPKAFDLAPTYGNVVSAERVVIEFCVDGETAKLFQLQETQLTAIFKISSNVTVAALFTSELAKYLNEVCLRSDVYDYLYGLDELRLNEVSKDVSDLILASVLWK